MNMVISFLVNDSDNSQEDLKTALIDLNIGNALKFAFLETKYDAKTIALESLYDLALIGMVIQSDPDLVTALIDWIEDNDNEEAVKSLGLLEKIIENESNHSNRSTIEMIKSLHSDVIKQFAETGNSLLAAKANSILMHY